MTGEPGGGNDRRNEHDGNGRSARRPDPGNELIPFDFATLDVVAGADVAFRFATLHCAEPDDDGSQKPLDFRLTIALRKIAARWAIVHEHHSVPAAS